MTEDKSRQLQIGIIIYNCKKDVKNHEEISQMKLKPINNFVDIIEKRFNHFVEKKGRHLNIFAPKYKIYCGTETIPTVGREIDIYGEEGLHEFVKLAKENEWKVYDKNLDCFIEFNVFENSSYSEYKKLIQD